MGKAEKPLDWPRVVVTGNTPFKEVKAVLGYEFKLFLIHYRQMDRQWLYSVQWFQMKSRKNISKNPKSMPGAIWSIPTSKQAHPTLPPPLRSDKHTDHQLCSNAHIPVHCLCLSQGSLLCLHKVTQLRPHTTRRSVPARPPIHQTQESPRMGGWGWGWGWRRHCSAD